MTKRHKGNKIFACTAHNCYCYACQHKRELQCKEDIYSRMRERIAQLKAGTARSQRNTINDILKQAYELNNTNK